MNTLSSYNRRYKQLFPLYMTKPKPPHLSLDPLLIDQQFSAEHKGKSHDPSIVTSLPFEFGGFVVRLLSMMFFTGVDPNVNSWGGMTKEGCVKMELVGILLKAGAGIGSLFLAKPKLKEGGFDNDGNPMAGLLSIDPKSFFSYS